MTSDDVIIPGVVSIVLLGDPDVHIRKVGHAANRKILLGWAKKIFYFRKMKHLKCAISFLYVDMSVNLIMPS